MAEIRHQLKVAAARPRILESLTNSAGLERWPPRSVRVQVPASLLRPNDYKLVLSRQGESGSWEDADEYFFRARSG